jgi:hypothetical protein
MMYELRSADFEITIKSEYPLRKGETMYVAFTKYTIIDIVYDVITIDRPASVQAFVYLERK